MLCEPDGALLSLLKREFALLHFLKASSWFAAVIKSEVS